jgi:hypothetical protein
MVKELESDLVEKAPKSMSRTRSGAPGSANLVTAFMVEAGPTSYRAAMASKEADQWDAAINSEKTSLEEHEAFEFVDQAPDHANIIDGKWVLQRKLKVDGSIDKHKARLVARGDRQKEGIDYFDITSPVVDASIIRCALGLAVQRGMHMAILDVPTAFLGSNLEETICM